MKRWAGIRRSSMAPKWRLRTATAISTCRTLRMRLKQMTMIIQYYDRKLNFSSNVNYRVETSDGEELLSGFGTDGYIDKRDSEHEYWIFVS